MDLARQDCKWMEAAAQSMAIMSAEQEAELLAEQRVALADLSAKHIADAWAAGFLEAVEVGAEAGANVVGMGEAAEGSAGPMVEAAATEPVDESRVPEDDDNADNEDKTPSTPKKCNKCWADNDPECCWYPTSTQTCYCCNALKRACTFSGRKSCKCGKVDPHVQCNFEKAVLVWHVRAFVVAQQELVTTSGMTSLSTASLALPTSQESGIAIDVAASEPATPKGKAKAVAAPQKQRASSSGDEQPTKQS
ncbi:hypothetical protein C0992_004915 [Termitomyces sp. T32_za158]|nr:hypothetical protein C0992_004915 [Termitomyces sp. T32_za158]